VQGVSEVQPLDAPPEDEEELVDGVGAVVVTAAATVGGTR